MAPPGDAPAQSKLASALVPAITTVAGVALLTRPLLNALYDWVARSRPGEPAGQAFLAGNYGPVDKEVHSMELQVEGQVPEGLEGAYLRTGPNPHMKPVGGYHWFDGDGMIHAVRFKGGKALSYANHLVRTAKVKQEKARGKALIRKAGDLNGVRGVILVLLDKLKVKLGAIKAGDGLGTANTAMVYHAKRILSLNEGDLPYQLRMLCNGIVETVGRLVLKDQQGTRTLPGRFTAHPKVDHKTGDMFFFGYDMEVARVTAGMLDGKGELTKQWAINVDYPSMMHDCAMTEHYAIIMQLPLTPDPQKMVKDNLLPIGFNASLPSKMGLVKRSAPDCTARDVKHPDAPAVEVQWFDVPSCYIFHVANAWEDEQGRVHLVACRFERFNFHGLNNKTETDIPPLEEQQMLYEYILDPATGKAESRQLSSLRGVDFPVINQPLACYPTRYTWATQFEFRPQTVEPIGIAKFDLARSGKEDALVATIRYPEGCYGGEAVFAPRPNASSEDDGWMLVFVFNEATQKSAMHIYDAKTMDPNPLAKVYMPQRVPYGFHGTFVPQDQLQLHASSFA